MHRDTRESWHDQPIPTLTAQFHTDVLHGLTPSEAARRLQQCGPSELRKATIGSPLALLMGQCGNLVIWVLIGAPAYVIFNEGGLVSSCIHTIIHLMQPHKARLILSAA